MSDAMPAFLFVLASNKVLLGVFRKLLERRKASLVELAEPDKIDEVALQMETLRSNNLVAEERAPAREWNTYYVTAQGLEMDRNLKRLGS
jgi:hypothetical protein